MKAQDGKLIIEHAYHWEKTTPDVRYFNQPMGGGVLKTYTWKEAMDEARRMAAYLTSLDFPPKSHIALVSKNTAWWIIADLAIWMAGHVSIPLYPTCTPDTVQYVLEHSESKLLFFGKLDHPDDIKAGIPEGLPCVAMPLSENNDFQRWEEIIASNEPMQGETKRDPEEMATIVYTSGTTGRAKGAMLSFKAMSVGTDELVRSLLMTERDRMLSYLPLSHVFERWLVECCSLRVGMELFFAESLDTFVGDLQRARPTLFVSVPRLWLKFQMGVQKKMPQKKLDLFLKIPILNNIVRKKVLTGLGLDAVRFAGSGSAPVPAELIEWYHSLGLELLEGYGMTENFCYSHMCQPGQVKPGYVGTAHRGVETKISEEGEILVKSPSSMMGYYKEPELSAAAFTEDGFLKTGDRGEIDGQGRLRITGRVKELFKTSKGKYVSPAPIENRLLTHPDVEMACVEGAGQPAPYALLMLGEDARKRAAAGEQAAIMASIGTHLDGVNQQLDHHERLAFATVVKDEWLTENGFLTPTMKMKRAAVEKAYKPNEEAWYAQGDKVIWQKG
jgi:long-subunit acyl-CoA synthetase (AMP-forming)